MKKFILISPKNRTAYNFRGDLMKAIQKLGYEVIVTGPNQDSIDRIKELGVKFVEVPMNKNGINPFSDLRYMWGLYKVMKREKVDASLGYTIKPFLYGSIAARMAGVKNRSCMIAGAGFLFASKSLKARIIRKITFFLYRLGLGSAHNVIFQNIDDLNEFVECGLVKREKCHVVNGSGVNMAKFTPSGYPEKPAFFFLGRLIHSKGAMDFMKAAKILKEKYPDARFMILGKVEEAVNDSIKNEEIKPYVESGVIEHFGETDNIAQYYEMTSVFVLPTAYREGTPRVILEAMACARPIITTFTPGCKETVVDSENGFFTPTHDPETLAEKMEYFILHPEKVAEMGAKSLEVCKNKYEVGIINENMIKFMKLK